MLRLLKKKKQHKFFWGGWRDEKTQPNKNVSTLSENRPHFRLLFWNKKTNSKCSDTNHQHFPLYCSLHTNEAAKQKHDISQSSCLLFEECKYLLQNNCKLYCLQTGRYPYLYINQNRHKFKTNLSCNVTKIKLSHPKVRPW